MKRILKSLRLPSPERNLLIKALVLVAVVRLALWTVPFRKLRGILRRTSVARSSAPAGKPPALERPVWAVQAVSRLVPGATCLTQALAAQVLLRRYGHAADLRIGVAKDRDGKFAAHAWVETQGKVLLGGTDLEDYVPLPHL